MHLAGHGGRHDGVPGHWLHRPRGGERGGEAEVVMCLLKIPLYGCKEAALQATKQECIKSKLAAQQALATSTVYWL